MAGFGLLRRHTHTTRRFLTIRCTLLTIIGLLYPNRQNSAGIAEIRWFGCLPINVGGAPNASGIVKIRRTCGFEPISHLNALNQMVPKLIVAYAIYMRRDEHLVGRGYVVNLCL